MEYAYDVFLICPVREADQEDKDFIKKYIYNLKSRGKKVYYPAEDTKQEDSSGGYQICSDNCYAMENSKEIHVYLKPKSDGSRFDLGMAFLQHRTERKKIHLANRSQVEKMVEEQKQKGTAKSFEMILLRLDDLAKE